MPWAAGDVVVLPFPYTDLASEKQRPALVLTPPRYNETQPDVLAAYVTSVKQTGPYAVEITDDEMARGHLVKPSWVRADKVATLDHGLIRKRVGRLEASVMAEVRARWTALLEDRLPPDAS